MNDDCYQKLAQCIRYPLQHQEYVLRHEQHSVLTSRPSSDWAALYIFSLFLQRSRLFSPSEILQPCAQRPPKGQGQLPLLSGAAGGGGRRAGGRDMYRTHRESRAFLRSSGRVSLSLSLSRLRSDRSESIRKICC